MAQQAGTEMVGSGSGAFELCLLVLENVRFGLGAFMLELTTSGNLAHYCTVTGVVHSPAVAVTVDPPNIWCPSRSHSHCLDRLRHQAGLLLISCACVMSLSCRALLSAHTFTQTTKPIRIQRWFLRAYVKEC